MKTEKREKNKNNNKIMYVLVVVIMLLIITLGLFSQVINRIGYSQTSNNSVDIALKVTNEDVGSYLLAKLNMLDVTQFDTKRIIAPGSYGRYKFLVRNLTDEDLVYNIQFSENNKYNMNIRYKLKQENVCLSGREDEWKKANEIKVQGLSIASQDSAHYTIYWTWIDNEEDDSNQVEKDYLEYILGVGLYAQYKEGN